MASTPVREFQPIADRSANSNSRGSGFVEDEYIELLAEVHDLLNDYAPAWYSQELQERIERTLVSLRCH